MSLVKGKKGLIMGVANERSIAWGISQKLAEAGAELAFTYLGDALKKRVVPLAKSLNSEFILSCNVENKEEIIQVMDDLRSAKVDFITIGQYLQPSVKHHPLDRYYHPNEFKELENIAKTKGFLLVSSSPLTRSSYHADEDFRKLQDARNKQLECHPHQ